MKREIYLCSMENLGREQIDFVDICLPTHLYLPMIRQVSDFVKNIICEKPLAVHETEVREIRRIAKEKGLHIMVAHVVRFWDQYVKTYEMVQKGILREINSVRCTRRQKCPAWSSDNWLKNVSLSGGLVFDLMIHDIDYVVWLLGKPDTVAGEIVSDKDGLPIHAKARLFYENRTVDMFASWGMPAGFADGNVAYSLEIIGENQMIYFDEQGQYVWTDDSGRQEFIVDMEDPYKAELQYFAECCEKKMEPARCEISSVLESMEVARAIERSAQEQRKITMIDEVIEHNEDRDQ